MHAEYLVYYMHITHDNALYFTHRSFVSFQILSNIVSNLFFYTGRRLSCVQQRLIVWYLYLVISEINYLTFPGFYIVQYLSRCYSRSFESSSSNPRFIISETAMFYCL